MSTFYIAQQLFYIAHVFLTYKITIYIVAASILPNSM